MVSIIIPVYNEENTITDCLLSLNHQSVQDLEIIIVEDGSTDKSRKVIWKTLSDLNSPKFNVIYQKHQGTALARNHGAGKARGEILVFADADMTFQENYVENIISPIINNQAKGTFTKEEYVSNFDNVWARCWNYNENIANNRRIPENYPDASPVFRAILKKEFDRVGGFDNIGFTDDWTLSRKLGYQAKSAHNAICYHKNPRSLPEIYTQARWIGKNEFISGTPARRIIGLIRFNPVVQLVRSLFIAVRHNTVQFIIFSSIYYTGISVSIIRSFIGEQKIK